MSGTGSGTQGSDAEAGLLITAPVLTSLPVQTQTVLQVLAHILHGLTLHLPQLPAGLQHLLRGQGLGGGYPKIALGRRDSACC